MNLVSSWILIMMVFFFTLFREISVNVCTRRIKVLLLLLLEMSRSLEKKLTVSHVITGHFAIIHEGEKRYT